MQTVEQNEYQEWPPVYIHVKSNSYRSVCTAINTYQSRLQNLLTPDMHQPTLLLKQCDHRRMLGDLKYSYQKILDDLKMIDLDELGYSVRDVFNRMCECLELYYNNVQLCVRRIVEENSIHHARYVHQSKCSECHSNAQKSKIESMMSIMTLTTTEPSQEQLSALTQQFSTLSTIYSSSSDIELSAMIEDILKRKEMILGAKNLRVNNIYEEIMQYLENIPQSTLNLSRDGGINKICASQFNIGNFSEQLEENFGKMLRNPIKKLIKRVLEYAKCLYSKEVPQQTIGTQTLMIKDEDNIKMLLKNNETIKKQCDQLKKIRREAEKQMLKLMDCEQKNQIKISQISTQNMFLHERLEKANAELIAIKIKLEASETSKKQMSEKLVKDYTSQRAQFLRSIRELELKIQITDHELMRLRKQVQSSMVHESTETTNLQFAAVEVQTEERISFYDLDNRNSYANQSKKNAISKFAYNRRSDNNDSQLPDQEQKHQDFLLGDNEARNHKPRNKSRHSRLKAKLESSKSIKSIKSVKNLNINDDEDQVELHNEDNQCHETQAAEVANNLKTTKKRQSIVENLNEPMDQGLKKIDDVEPKVERRHEMKKYTQTVKIIQKQKRYSSNARTQLDLHFQKCIQNSKQKQKDKEQLSRQSDYKKFSPSNSIIRSRPKLQSSRMFVSKPHCSPYIGQGTYTPNGSLQSHWIDMLEVNNAKREADLLKDTENVQKIQFISKIIKKYSRLKECGLLNRINEIVSSNDLDDEQFQPVHENAINHSPQEQESQYPRLRKAKREGTHKTVVLKVPNEGEDENKNHIMKTKQLFGVKQVILVFGSTENAMKFELNVEIWAQLDNSLMIDYNFMNFCDHLEVFMMGLLKAQPELFTQLRKFLTNPTAFTQNAKIYLPACTLDTKKNQLNHSRNLSHNPCRSHLSKRGILTKRDNLTNQNHRPHQLRDIIHKLLRYHKISHRKCNHMEQFLALIGFKQRIG